MWCAAIQRVAGNPDRHDAFMPACAALLEDLAADPFDGTGAPVRKGNAIADAQILDGLFTAIREDRRPAQETLRAAATATVSARASMSTGAAVSAGASMSTGAAPPPPAPQCIRGRGGNCRRQCRNAGKPGTGRSGNT
jgi:hypothetical protein